MDDVTVRIPRALVVIVTVIVIGGALGMVGFLLGRDSVDDADARQLSAETRSGPHKQGREAGYEQGLRAGREAASSGPSYHDGVVKGRRDGYDDGASEALGLAQFDFNPGAYYIVQFAQGSDRPRLRIDTVAGLFPGRSYEICNTTELCYR
jgi:hypothetical protein